MSTATDAGTPAAPASSNRGRIALLVVFGLLFGLLAGRFLAAGPDEGDLPPVTVGGVTADERIAALRADLERDPDDVAALQEIASLTIQQAAITADPSYYAQARSALDRAEELVPDDPSNGILRGNLLLALHEFDDAAREARAVLDQQPDNSGALTVMVDAQVELGRYDAAAETLQRLLDVRPALPALARTSYLRELNGDLDGAAQAMQQAVTAGSGLRDQLANVTTLLGDVQLRRGDLDAAADAYGDALAIRDDFAPARVGQARLMARTGDLEGAIAQLRSVSDRVPYPAALTLLVELQEVAGDREAAADTGEVLRAVTALQAESGQVVDLELADFEASAGDASRAYQLAQDTYAARPTIYGSSVLAWALYGVDEPGEAERYARESLELGSLDPVLNYRAARILADLGETDVAVSAITRALQHDPSGTFRHREDIVELAGELYVDVPEAWAQAAGS